MIRAIHLKEDNRFHPGVETLMSCLGDQFLIIKGTSILKTEKFCFTILFFFFTKDFFIFIF